MNTSRGPVSFKDVAVDFTQEEWQQLDPDEKITYGDVMLENYSHLVSVGYDYHQAKRHHGVEMKEVEQGEEPWIMEGEFPCQYIPDSLCCPCWGAVVPSQLTETDFVMQMTVSPIPSTEWYPANI
ncbi:putative postmeiotic segregation increased 2-like protein 3 [Hylobates moloch]|uniref:putative postmeiotic segregation increased 2-like protein 3 n=1 Tax=Hylobates moloch TaxID=81572 RepID=UPI0026744AD8|nr:putative postmeiotic segregation increased 2-like protein 3 [Hylobates moloch]